jgi:hypothetical protein
VKLAFHVGTRSLAAFNQKDLGQTFLLPALRFGIQVLAPRE